MMFLISLFRFFGYNTFKGKVIEEEAGAFRRGEEGVFNGDRCIEQRNKIMFEIYYNIK